MKLNAVDIGKMTCNTEKNIYTVYMAHFTEAFRRVWPYICWITRKIVAFSGLFARFSRI